jgi:diguanylate cyclase (GGDEF)-like protein/PAS domain S-box-containing protein
VPHSESYRPAAGSRERAKARARTDVLRRIAGTVAIMLYEMELLPDGSFVCHEYLGLESVLGAIPEPLSAEEAYDAAVHPDDREAYDATFQLLERCEPAEVEYRLVGFDGCTRWVWDRMQPARTADGRLLVDGVVTDITERKLVSEELAYVARHDQLTGLPNRTSSQEHLRLALARAEQVGNGVAALFIDLDDFKLVNDSFGHAAGDELLRAVAARLRSAAPASDMIARHSGDEFLLVLSDLLPSGEGSLRTRDVRRLAERVAGTIRRVLKQPFLVAGIEIYVSASVGISLYPGDALDAEALLKHADIAMYEAKAAGRNGHRLYMVDRDNALERLSMASRLRRTVERGHGFVLEYQPLVELETATVVGVEALLRWEDGEHGRVMPGEFIPLAERTGLISAISDWVIDEACRQASAWQRDGLDIYVSINLPPSYCDTAGLRKLVTAAEAHQLNPDRLMLEITESAMMTNASRQTERALAQLRADGLRLAIDDFGTGHSSLGRLSQSWVSMLKIDRSFIDDLPESEHAGLLVTSMVQLAHTLGLEAVAEGIETDEQRQFLLDHGCRLGQGYYYSRPVPAEEISRLCEGDGLRGRRAA